MTRGGDSMDHVVVTIARQYGSGGKTVGQMYAQKHGIPFHERDILRMAADDSGINEVLFGDCLLYTSPSPRD